MYGVLVPLGTADADVVASCKARDGWDMEFIVSNGRTAPAIRKAHPSTSNSPAIERGAHQKLVDLEQKVRVLEAKLAAETHAKEEALGKLSGLAVENEELEERVTELEAQLFRKQQDIATLQKKDAAAQRAANLANRATLLYNHNRLHQQITNPSETPDALLSVLQPQENVAEVEAPKAFPPPHSPANAQPIAPSGVESLRRGKTPSIPQNQQTTPVYPKSTKRVQSSHPSQHPTTTVVQPPNLKTTPVLAKPVARLIDETKAPAAAADKPFALQMQPPNQPTTAKTTITTPTTHHDHLLPSDVLNEYEEGAFTQAPPEHLTPKRMDPYASFVFYDDPQARVAKRRLMQQFEEATPAVAAAAEHDTKKTKLDDDDSSLFNTSTASTRSTYTRVFLITRIPNSRRKQLTQWIQNLGGKVVAPKPEDTGGGGWCNECTHLVCGKPVKTEKCYAAIAKGAWLMKEEYIEKSFREGKFLDEEDYEWAVEVTTSGNSLSSTQSKQHSIAETIALSAKR
ncbi:DNA topoisomerase 2-binding protein 1, partial [Podochytrium sp. JEL0797]